MKNTIIRGLVINIVDGNTFEMSVHDENGAKSIVKRTENIRILGMDKPSTSTLSGILAKLELEKKIIGRTLECEVIRTNGQNQLIAVVSEKYLNSSFLYPIENQV